jgi:hypothetical protein
MNGGNAQEQYEEYYAQAEKEAIAAYIAKSEKEDSIYETKKGGIYQARRFACSDYEYDYDKWKSCSTSITKALEDLKKTPEYAEFRALLKDEIYYSSLQYGLEAILQTDALYSLDKGLTKEKRAEELNNAINSVTRGDMANASDVLLTSAEDTHEDEQCARDTLRSIVEEVEANDQ